MSSINFIALDESSLTLWITTNMSHTLNSILLSNQSLLLHMLILKSKRPRICSLKFVTQGCSFRRSCVRVVTSDHAGMGKSFYIQQLATRLQRSPRGKHAEVCHVVPIHGPEVTADTVMELINKHSQSSMFHIDIAASVRLCT